MANTSNQVAYTAEVYSLPILEARSLEFRYWQGCALFEGSRRGSCLASSSFGWLPTILGISWLGEASLQSLPLSLRGFLADVTVSKFPSSYKDTSHWT